MNTQATKEEKAASKNVSFTDMDKNTTYKKGIHVMFSMNDEMIPRWPSRYSSNVNPTFPRTGKTNAQASQISKLCM